MKNNSSTHHSKSRTDLFYRQKPESLKLRHTGISTKVDSNFDSFGLITLTHIEAEKPKEHSVRNGKVRP